MSFFKNKKENCSKEHSPMIHILHMVLCCGLPIVILFLLPFIAGYSPAIAGILGVIAPFICPIMMGSMIFMMFKSQKHSCCKEPNQQQDQSLPRNN